MAQFGVSGAADLVAHLDWAGFRNKTGPDDAHLIFRKRTGGRGNYIVVVLVWKDGRGNIERIAVN